jgi:hypothetical protein
VWTGARRGPTPRRSSAGLVWQSGLSVPMNWVETQMDAEVACLGCLPAGCQALLHLPHAAHTSCWCILHNAAAPFEVGIGVHWG